MPEYSNVNFDIRAAFESYRELDSIQKIIDDMLRAEVTKAFMRLFEEDVETPSDWKGFTGIDEVGDTHWWKPPEHFTPEHFSWLWDKLTREEKLAYVKSLIS
jgi:hypothetical protein